MDPIKFPEVNSDLAKGQPQYRMLPTFQKVIDENTPDWHVQFTCKYELSDLEVEQIIKTRSLYFSQFGRGFNPIFPQIDSPFGVCEITWRIDKKGLYSFTYVTKLNELHTISEVPLENALDILIEHTQLRADQLLFKEAPKMFVTPTGDIEEQ